MVNHVLMLNQTISVAISATQIVNWDCLEDSALIVVIQGLYLLYTLSTYYVIEH